MPFKVGEDFESCQLPEYIEPYWPLISTCLEPQMARASWHMWPRRSIPSDVGKVYYLTIQESWVDKGNSQRRPGLHVDSPGKVKFKGETPDVDRKGNGISQRYFGHRWGNGCAHYVRQETEEEYHPPVYTMKANHIFFLTLQGSLRAFMQAIISVLTYLQIFLYFGHTCRQH